MPNSEAPTDRVTTDRVATDRVTTDRVTTDRVTIDRDAIKARYIALRGYWRPWTEALLQDNPRFLDRYAGYAGHPASTGPLSPLMVELLYVALDASSTHLYGSGLRTHMVKALEAGATPRQLLDVLHRVTLQGLDAVYEAAAILADETGLDPQATVADPALQARIDAVRLPADGAALALLERLDPGFLPVLLDFIEEGRPDDGLSPAECALVDVALSGCFTGFNGAVLRRRIRAALALGLSPAELLQAIQLGAHLAVHGMGLGAGLLAELHKG